MAPVSSCASTTQVQALGLPDLPWLRPAAARRLIARSTRMVPPALKTIALATMTLCVLTTDVTAQTKRDALADLLSQVQAQYRFPGATAAIALPDSTLVTAATGLADIEMRRAMSPEDRMLAASIGKTFVAATALSLEADDLLSRADLVSDHIGDLEGFDRLPNHASMTVGDLMRHTAGLPDHVHQGAFQAEMARRMTSGAAAMSPEEAIAFVFDAEPLFPAGSGWSYSDTGYLLLGLVIEAASDRDYYDLVAERFLAPLALGATTPSDRPDLPGLEVGYVDEDNPFGLPSRTMDSKGRMLWDPSMEWTGGGLVSTSGDLATWGQALFTEAAMGAPYLDRMLDAVPVAPDAPGILYGAGVAIYADTPLGPVYGHGGWIPGYVSSLRHYADHDVTVAFQINTDAGVTDDGTDLVPVLEAALADLAIAMAQTSQ